MVKVAMANLAGLVPLSLERCPVIEAYKKNVDQTLLTENLKLTTHQRVQKMIAASSFAEALRASVKKVTRP